MLDPQDRHLLLDALRPPEGYELSFAIGTTYTLDLLALLTAPLGFTIFELAGPPGAELAPNDAVRLLGVLRRHAERITVFCEAGRIAVPPKHAVLFGELERSVIEVRPPQGYSFHPKVWTLRYESPDGPVRYRVLCLTRNLTFDRAWDTMVALDGEVKERKVAFAANHPLADFVAALPPMALREAPEVVRERAALAASELRRVQFDLPDDFDEYRFWAFGLPGKPRPKMFGGVDRALVVSPFLTAQTIAELRDYAKVATLVSRTDALDALPRDVLRDFDQVYAFNTDATTAQPESDESAPPDANTAGGLHAKLYVLESGWDAMILTGSANATHAAFGGNVEFVTELMGRKSRCGIECLLSQEPGKVGLRDVLVEYDIETPVPVIDEALEAQRDRLDQVRRTLGTASWTATIDPAGGDTFRVALAPDAAIELAADVRVLVRPVLLPATVAIALPVSGEPVVFTPVSFEGLTSFFAFDVRLQGVAVEEPCKFVVNARLVGEPAGRRERITQYLLRDREQVVRFLLLLLSGAPDDLGAAVEIGLVRPEGQGERAGASDSAALLEPLLRALDRDPGRLDEIATVLRDLQATDEGRAKLPPGIETVWEPIWQARQALREGDPA